MKRLKQIFDKVENLNIYLRPYEIIVTSSTSGFLEHINDKSSIDYIKRSILSYRLCRISNLAIAIFENGNEKVIGSTGLFQRSQTSPFTYELGYVLSETYWNKGYAREAVTTLINYAFQNFKIERIEAFCISNNILTYFVIIFDIFDYFNNLIFIDIFKLTD